MTEETLAAQERAELVLLSHELLKAYCFTHENLLLGNYPCALGLFEAMAQKRAELTLLLRRKALETVENEINDK